MVELYESGLSTRAVADQVGVSKTGVLSTLHAANVTLRPRGGRNY
ncbi:helix-turn-helix domain-containing protein [Pseudolysinimonas sp.]